MRAPIAVYVIYNTQFDKANQLLSYIYKWLCRDVRNSLSEGLDIPVYYGTEKNNYDVDFSRADKTCILILVDMHMVSNKQMVISKIREWNAKGAAGNSIKICPIKLCDYAYDVLPADNKEQYIVLDGYDIIENKSEFQTKVYDCLIRFLQNKHAKIQVFVSHSKKDKGKIGEVRAKELVDYLRTKTKLDSFFDVTDILDGSRFDQQIERGVENALLMVLYTNTYSDREWCRRELIAAKDHHVPAVVVMMMDGVAKRVFPYIGNIPCLEYNGDWREPINLLLRTALDECHEKLLLGTLQGKRKDVQVLPFPPELYNLRSFPQEKSCVLYPEPPLGQEELAILQQAHSSIKFLTPMEYASVGLNLSGKHVAISISLSEDTYKYGIVPEMLDDLSIEISKHILKAGGKMIYGGDLRKGGFTKLFANLSDQYGAFEKTDPTMRYFKNYVAWPHYDTITEDDICSYDHNRVELILVEKNVNAAKSLTMMRTMMESGADARVIVGGKMNEYAGIMPGVLEEFQIAMKSAHPVYVVGGLGGAARYVAEVMLGHVSPEMEYEWIKDYRMEDLNNGLGEEENRRLFISTNAMEIVSLILKGLKNTLQ